MPYLHSFLGFLALAGIAVLLSEDRGRVRWRKVVAALALQAAFALILLKVPVVQRALLGLNGAAAALEKATTQAAAYMFGYLAGGPLPFAETGASTYIVAFRVLPMIIVTSALSSLLFHWGVLPFVIRVFSRLLRRTLKLSGLLGFVAGSSPFLGVIETPIAVKPYLEKLSRPELFAVLCVSMANVAGTVMVLYASVLSPVVPDALGHIVAASFISVPAALMVSHAMVPEGSALPSAEPKTAEEYHGSMDALMRGTADGTRMAIDVAATIVVLFALVNLVNLALPGGWTVQRLAGIPLRPLVWLTGIPWAETRAAAELAGVKTILNEFVAYLELAKADGAGLSERSRMIATYAFCGFANLGSYGILVGGLGAVMPGRRAELITLGAKAIVGGTLATFMTGALVGVLI